MVLAAINKARQLLYLGYSGQVRPGDLEHIVEEADALIGELKPGFRLLVDLTNLESMDVGCATKIGELMESAERGGVSTVVRVIPDPHKDIGMNILTIFHYRKKPQVFTCKTMAEAANHLSL